MSEIHVRGARPEDAAEVAALLAELGYPDNDETTLRRRLAIWEKESHPFYRRLGYTDWCERSARYRKDLVPGASATGYGARFQT